MPIINLGERVPDDMASMPVGDGRREPQRTLESRARHIPYAAEPPRTMNRAIGWYLRGSMTRVVFGVAALFIAIFLLLAQTVMAQRQARQEVMLQDESMLSLNALMEIMLDAETGQRGYLLTSNPSYLDPYERAKEQLEPEVANLQRMAERSDDQEQAHIVHAEQLIRTKIDEMDHTVELARAGMVPTAVAFVQTNAGQRDMDALRQELRWLRSEKAQQRQAAFERVQMLESRLLPLVGLLGLGIVLLMVVAMRGERHRAWAEAESRQFAALRNANEQTQLLARELNHRVKNLFSVVMSIITISARKQAPTGEVLDDIRARVHALSLAHSSSQGLGTEESCRLADVVANIMRPYGDHPEALGHADRVRVTGPDAVIAPRMITPMGLLIHELATNASKYGALSVASGIVEISWRIIAAEGEGRTLVFDWIETGGPALEAAPTPIKTGFGSRLTAMAAQQMGGRIERTFAARGAHINLICPLP